MADTVQQVKDRLSIVDVVGGYVKLERSGTNFRARCPFHAEKTPSFFVSPDRGTFHCFGCSVGGDIFSFVEQIEGLDFKGALKVLADRAGVPLVYEQGSREQKDERDRLFELLETATIFYTSRLNDAAKKYLHDRGMTDATINEFRLGYAGEGWTDACDHLKSKKFTDKEIIDSGVGKKGDRGLLDKFRNRIMFPIGDSAGRIVGFSGRIFGENASPDAPKYLNSPETPLFHKSKILYGFDKAKLSIRKLNCAVLVEGQMDLLSSHQAGWGNTVAVSGTAFTPEHAVLIHRMTDNLVIALDADQAGIKAAGRAARAALQGGLNVKVARLPTGFDPADLIVKQGPDAWKTAIKDSKDIITFLLDVLDEHAKDRDAFRRTVELIVLPFVSDIKSPIAREQHIREIARRLAVSEHAVQQTLQNVPTIDGASSNLHDSGGIRDAGSQGRPAATNQSDGFGRARQAFSLFLWQRSIAKPAIDIDESARSLKEAVGEEVFTALEALSEGEREALRFSAEEVFGSGVNVGREFKTLTGILGKERLGRELAEATDALKKAEAVGDEPEVGRLVEQCRLLTSRIAQMHDLG